jgi:retron-type reverse transcriptase
MFPYGTVLDRFIQQASLRVLQADWTFSEASYGFRPQREPRASHPGACQACADALQTGPCPTSFASA